MHFHLAVAGCLLVAACGSNDPAPAPGSVRVAQTATSSSHVITPDGRRIELEVASNPEARARGLMFRDQLERGTGMLFVFPVEEIQGFWMKNTLIHLDMLWMDSNGSIVHIERHVPPCPGDPCPSYSSPVPAKYVLEIAGGEANFYGLEPGQSLRLEGIDGYRVE